jgi:general stress protein 26
MDPEKETRMKALLAEPLLARLATVNPKTLQPHITLVWFLWDETSLWISAFSSTRKVRELVQNPRAAVLIEPKQPDSQLQAVLLEGPVEVINRPRSLVEEMSNRIYTKYLGPEGVLAAEPQSWMRDPENRLIKLTPARTIVW